MNNREEEKKKERKKKRRGPRAKTGGRGTAICQSTSPTELTRLCFQFQACLAKLDRPTSCFLPVFMARVTFSRCNLIFSCDAFILCVCDSAGGWPSSVVLNLCFESSRRRASLTRIRPLSLAVGPATAARGKEDHIWHLGHLRGSSDSCTII